MRSLREMGDAPWKEIIEPLIVFDQVLREDPAGAYPRMDFESRELYRKKIVDIAERCDFTEMAVAQEALAMAHEAQAPGAAGHPCCFTAIARRILPDRREADDLLYHKVQFRPAWPNGYSFSCGVIPTSFTFRVSRSCASRLCRPSF